MKCLTANSWFDYIEWRNRNFTEKLSVLSIQEIPLNSGAKRNVIFSGLIEENSIEKQVIFKQFVNKGGKEKQYFDSELSVYNDENFLFKPRMLFYDDKFKILGTEHIEGLDIKKALIPDRRNVTLNPNGDLEIFLTSYGASLAKFHQLNPERVQKKRNINIKSDFSPQYLEYLHDLNKVNGPVVFCHNDLKLDNLIYYDKKVTFIDFELAEYQNPYLDYASVFEMLLFIIYDSKFFELERSNERILEFYKQCLQTFFNSYYENQTEIKKIEKDLIISGLKLKLIEFSNSKFFDKNITYLTSWIV